MSIQTTDPQTLAAQTALTRRQAEVAIRHAHGESIEDMAKQLDDPSDVVRARLKAAKTKAREADMLVTALPCQFHY